MLNFSKTEKSLKHWLKNKVTITTSTVIGFLIMGTISFGAAAVVKGETQKIESDTTLSQPIEVTKQDETVGVSIEKENIKLTNDSTVTATSKNTKAFGIKSDVKANVINNGTITVEALNEDKPDEPETDKDVATAIALNKGGKVENNGDISATGFRAIGIDADNGTEVINTKNITITGVGNYNGKAKTGNAIGIRLYNDSTAVNRGDITTTSKDLSQGVNINVSKDSNLGEKNIFENYGTITAKGVDKGGGSSQAIYVKNNTDKNVKIVNEAGGTLTAVGDKFKEDSSTATVKLEGLVNQGQPKGTTTFINNGTILTENNGAGIYASDNKSSVTNNGSITVSKGNKVTGVETFGSFVNTETGKIDVNSTSNAHGLLIKGTGNAVNQGTISVTGGNNGVATGVETIGNASFTNEKYIIVNNTGDTTNDKNEMAYGVRLNNSNTFKNTGNITVEALDSAIGVLLDGGKNSNLNPNNEVIINTGSITAESTKGGMASAIYIKNTNENKNVNLAFSNSGTLTATGNQDTSVVKLETYKENGIDFTNTGTIEAGKGTGVLLAGSNITATNNGTIKVEDTGKVFDNYKSKGTATNNGIIQITNKTAEQLKNEKFDTSSLFSGNVTDKGMISDKDGYAVIGENTDTIAKVEITTGELNNYKDKVYFGKYDGSTIVGDESPTSIDTLNIIGNVGIKDGTNEVHLAVNSLNFDKNGQFNVKDGNSLYLGDENKEININSAVTGEKIIVGKGSELALQNANVNKEVNISGEGSIYTLGNTTIASNVTSKEFEVFDGNTLFNGKLSTDTVTVGHDEQSKDTKLTLSSGASFGKETDLNTENGTTVFEIGAKGENALANSTGAVTVNGNVDFDTNKLTTNTIVELNNKKDNVVHNLNGAKYQEKTNEVYNTHLDKTNNTLEFAYNKSLYNNSKLNDLNNVMQGLNDKLSQNVTERSNQLDEIYSGNIYSETVRAAYDNVKLNEEAVLSLSQTAKAGETKTFGKLLYNKDKYTREGILNDYDAKVETTGLLAGAEYGVSDTTAVGAVFSGAKQDIDLTNGNADSDVFYLGLYGTKILGNYDFTAGLGYQFGKYDSDYNMAKNLSGSEKYDSNAINAYVQGRYTADLGDGVSLQPKVKLGYTYVEQDDVKDNNYEVKNADISTFDTEVGVDVVKAVQLDKANLTLKAGTSYIKTMGDTDKKFTLSTTNGSAEILGAELAENVVKFGVDAKVEIQNGLFYNVGADYRFGSQDTKSYSVNVGLGYKF